MGGRFEIFGGAVRAVFTELSPQRIALDWHFNSWKEGVVSKVQPCVCYVYCSAPALLFEPGMPRPGPVICRQGSRLLCTMGTAGCSTSAHAGRHFAGGAKRGLNGAEAVAPGHPQGGQVWRRRSRDCAKRLAPADPAQDSRCVWLWAVAAAIFWRGCARQGCAAGTVTTISTCA